jgi:hypothetical protein
MIRHHLFVAALLAAALLAPLQAADTPPKNEPAAKAKAEAGEAKGKRKGNPDRVRLGSRVKAVDDAGKTVTLAGRPKDHLVHITSETRLMKDGKPATFADIKVGEHAQGQGRRRADGNVDALSLRVGPPPAGAAKKKAEQPEGAE